MNGKFYTMDFSDNFSRETINVDEVVIGSSFQNIAEGNDLMPKDNNSLILQKSDPQYKDSIANNNFQMGHPEKSKTSWG